jgi:hypothetical protein
VAAADRRQEVRDAARAWQARGAIDAAALATVESLYPDDRRRLGPAFRVLVFGFTIVVTSALFGLLGLMVSGAGERGFAPLLTLWGLALVAATDLQIGAGRRRQGGTEAATAFLGVSQLVFGVSWSLSRWAGLRGSAALDAALVVTMVVCAAAAWRWGYTLFALAAAVAAFVLAARTPAGRAIWVVAGAVLAPLLAQAGDSPGLSPAHRRAARVMAVVALAFLYGGVHIGSWDEQAVERIAAGVRGERPAAMRWLFAVGTAIVPLVVVAWGLRSRRRWLIATGVAALLASLVTLRFYVHVAPLFSVLIASGAACLALAAALRRYLESGPGGERGGFTADPLFDDDARAGALELAAGAASLTPAARVPEEQAALQPGGGRYGGGGASGTF